MNKIYVSTVCPMCGKTHLLTMTNEQFERLEAGEEHIQDIFPDWSLDDRERLISGACPECWDKVFGGDDDGDDCLFDEDEDEYTPSSTAGDYGPSNPWNAPGMSVSDFI